MEKFTVVCAARPSDALHVFSPRMKSSLLLFLSLTAMAQAAVELASPFTSHMVLQRDQIVPVWGTAEEGENVTVEFAEQKVTVSADASGRWLGDVAPLGTTG